MEKITTDLQSIGMLRQYINERPTHAPLLTNEDIVFWLGFSERHKPTATRWGRNFEQEILYSKNTLKD